MILGRPEERGDGCGDGERGNHVGRRGLGCHQCGDPYRHGSCQRRSDPIEDALGEHPGAVSRWPSDGDDLGRDVDEIVGNDLCEVERGEEDGVDAQFGAPRMVAATNR